MYFVFFGGNIFINCPVACNHGHFFKPFFNKRVLDVSKNRRILSIMEGFQVECLGLFYLETYKV